MIRITIAIDAYRVSGPAKGLLDFLGSVRDRLEALVLVFQRGRRDVTEFRQACQRREIAVEVVWERHRYDVSVLSRALRAVRSFRPDLIQTHGYKADVVGLTVRA